MTTASGVESRHAREDAVAHGGKRLVSQIIAGAPDITHARRNALKEAGVAPGLATLFGRPPPSSTPC